MIKYDLHLLGWHAFQQLCLNICGEILGQTVSAFLDSNDAGKDGAFSGVWKQKDGEDLQGKFIIQCKFTNKRDHNLAMSELADEFEKVQTLVNDGECDCYVLMTNAGISGRFESAFKKKVTALGVKSFRIFGSDWIFNQITASKRLRMFVPRVYGLGDLSQILDERAYAQSKQLLASMREDLAKIVMTSAYHKAAKALSDHGFVLIIGEAAAGKTTIASMLAMAALDQWGLSTIKLDNAEQISIHWNPEDASQFYWIDDAFGMTSYESNLVSNWNHKLVHIRSMLKQGIKIVMTSRDYIYRRARADLKSEAFPLFNESQVVIDVHKLQQEEKEQILYNHLKLGSQPLTFIKEVKPFLPAIAAHERFIPETARRLADPAFTKGLYLWESTLMAFVDKQESHLKDLIRHLDLHSKGALALIYMNNGLLPSPIDPETSGATALSRLGSDIGNCILALDAMKDSLVQLTMIGDNAIWRFKHPTISDAYTAIIATSPEQLEIYLQGTAMDKVLDQVTCGNVDLEKIVIVPKSMFPLVIERMGSFKASGEYKGSYLSQWGAKRKVLTFLSRRCSKEFLTQYIAASPEIFQQLITPSMSFYYSAEIDLLIRLAEEELLPETYRKQFADYVAEHTVSGQDLYLLKNEDLQELFTAEELSVIWEKVRRELLPKIDTLREKRQSEFRDHNNDTSEEHMEDFLDKMNILLEAYEEEAPMLKKIEAAIDKAKEWVEENNADLREALPDRILDSSDAPLTTTTTRSIFDDIDEQVKIA